MTWSIPPLAARLADPGHRRFVGRQRELDLLEEVWDAVTRGERQAVFIAGEPGSGKTNLAAIAAQSLHAQGVAVLFGSSSPDLDFPYRPLVEALDQLLLAAEPGEIEHLIPNSAAELAKITTRIRKHRPELSAAPADRTEYRRDLFDAYVELITAVSSEQPLALILEDLQWSSAPTRLLLSHLIQTTDRERLLVIGTLRDTSPDRSDELAFTIADLYRLPGVTRFDLGGLALTDIEQFVAMAGIEDQPQVREIAALLMHQTGGNPFFLRELWRDLSRSGGLRALKTGGFTAPISVKDTIEKRLHDFDEPDLNAIELGAVLGEQFDLRIIIDASEYGSDSVLHSLDRACEYGLLISGPDPGSYVFHHALTRQAVLERIAPSRAARLHAALARVMERRFDSSPQIAPVLARLYGGARILGYESKHIQYLAEAARQAERGLAHEEAASLWESAARLQEDDSVAREGMLMSAARSRTFAGNYSEARRVYHELSGSKDPVTALRAAIGHEEASWRPGLDGGESVGMLAGALAHFDSSKADPDFIRGLAGLGRAHAFAGDADTYSIHLTRALALARRLGDETVLADVLVASLFGGYAPDQVNQNYELGQELHDIAMRIRNYDGLGSASMILGVVSYVKGDRTGWDSALTDLSLVAHTTGQPFWQWGVECHEFLRAFMAADFDAARQLAAGALQLGDQFGRENTEGPYGVQMYMIQRETDQIELIRPLISGDPSKDGDWLPGLLTLYAELGYREAAHKLLGRLVRSSDESQRKSATWPASVAFMAEAALGLGDEASIREVLPLVTEFDGCNMLMGPAVAAFGSGNRYIGQIHAALGQSDLAEEHLVKALHMDVGMGSIVHEAETRARYSLFLADTGRDVEALHHKEKALELASTSGHQRVLRLLEYSGGPYDHPSGLTPREREVLRLIARGASNKEIGDRLFISQNTAANHVRSILVKTMTSNRTQAAIYAAEHGFLD